MLIYGIVYLWLIKTMSNIFMEIYYDLIAAHEISNPEKLPYHAEVLDATGIQQARKMLADVYVRKGVVTPESLAEDGTLADEADPYWRRSIYYGVRSEHDPSRLLITSRLVQPSDEGVDSLQIHIDELDQDLQAELRNSDPAGIAEFAAYVKEVGLGQIESRLVSLYLIRKMVYDSQARGIKTWVFGMRPELRKKYERIFGPALERRGDTVHLGSFKADFVPYKIDVESSWRRLMTASHLRLGSHAIATFVGAAYLEQNVVAPQAVPPTPRPKTIQ